MAIVRIFYSYSNVQVVLSSPQPKVRHWHFLYVVFLLFSFTLKKKIRSPITLTEKLSTEKRHFNTGAYDWLMTEAPTRMFGLIIFFITESEVKKIQIVPHVGWTLWTCLKKTGVAEHLTW